MNAPHQFPDPSPSREGMADLAARVEAADGRSRMLDGEIAAALGEPDAFGSPLRHKVVRAHILTYTASLDAAMTLVPEGCRVEIDITPNGRAGARLRADHLGTSGIVDSAAATPALALTAAALRARAAQ